MRTDIAHILESAAGDADAAPHVAPSLARCGDVTLRTPPNWTAVAFVALLAGLHLANAAISFAAGHAAGYVSLLLGSALLAAAIACWHFRFEVSILPARHHVRLRHGVGRFGTERRIGFRAVRAVRLTLCNARHGSCESRIELLCPDEDVECPPTDTPREDALCLALMIGVPLIRVSDETMG